MFSNICWDFYQEKHEAVEQRQNGHKEENSPGKGRCSGKESRGPQGLQLCFVMGIAVVILKTVFSSWRSDYIQKPRPSPLSTGKMITTQAKRDSPLLAPALPCHRPHLWEPGASWYTKDMMGLLSAHPPWIFSNVKPGQRDGKSAPKPALKGFLPRRSGFDSAPTSASYLEGEAHSNCLKMVKDVVCGPPSSVQSGFLVDP